MAYPFQQGNDMMNMQHQPQLFGNNVPPNNYQYQQRPYYQANVNTVLGRVINNEAEIQASDVAMNGTISWFPMADGSCVVGRRMNPNGTITSVRYIPEAMPEQPKDQQTILMEKVDKILDVLCPPTCDMEVNNATE